MCMWLWLEREERVRKQCWTIQAWTSAEEQWVQMHLSSWQVLISKPKHTELHNVTCHSTCTVHWPVISFFSPCFTFFVKVDDYTVRSSADLGPLILVRLEKQKYWVEDNWFCRYVKVSVPGQRLSYTFPCYRWLVGDGVLVELREGAGQFCNIWNVTFTAWLMQQTNTSFLLFPSYSQDVDGWHITTGDVTQKGWASGETEDI